MHEQSKIPYYGFNVAVWLIVLSVGFTQLQIGTEVIPIIVGGIMATIALTVGYGMKNEIRRYIAVETLKNHGVDEKTKIEIDGKIYTIQKIGFTHVKLSEAESGDTIILHHSLWYKHIIIKE